MYGVGSPTGALGGGDGAGEGAGTCRPVPSRAHRRKHGVYKPKKLERQVRDKVYECTVDG